MSKSTALILFAAMLAMLAKLVCAANTVGTNDTVFFYGFGRIINEDGLARTYEEVKIFNHTPLVAEYVALLQRLEPGKQMRMEYFPFFLRLPGIIADFLAVLILLRIRRRFGGLPGWGILLFALSPVAFMVSGFHGNVDSVLSLLLLAAAWMALENRAALCGLALGLACNVKVAPLLIAPLFFAWWWQRRALAAFFLPASGVILFGWASALVYAPGAFLSNVLGYQGYWGIWGISYWLREWGGAEYSRLGFSDLTPAQKAVMSATKYLIIAGAGWVAWAGRKADASGLIRSVAWVWALFFVFATGVAPQYFVWLSPFLLLACPRWAGGVTVAASIFLFVFYNVTSNVRVARGKIISGDPWAMPWEQPWNLANSSYPHIQFWGPWHVLPWLTMIGCLVWLSVKIWRARGASSIS